MQYRRGISPLFEYKCAGGKMSVCYKKLWKMLIDKDMPKTQLIREAKISTNAMAKMGKGLDVRTEVLIKICKVLDCKIDDIIDYNMD